MKIEVSNGEIIDKLSILAIKLEKISDIEKVRNIHTEWKQIQEDSKELLENLDPRQYSSLLKVNYDLWDVEDKLRVLESKGIFKEEFIQLARSVYRLNDLRAEIKKQINITTNSSLVEEKSYEKY